MTDAELHTLQEAATLHRTRLLLGLTRGETVVAWADAQLLAASAPHDALTDIALTAPSDLTALRVALAPLAQYPEPHAVIRRVLREVASDLLDMRRSVADTATVLRQVRSMLPRSAETDAMLEALVETLMLAEAGIGETIDDAGDRLRQWARDLSGAESRSAG